ncbi:hypothetical protein M9458_015602, partial [Cirrhinus mrigala]
VAPCPFGCVVQPHIPGACVLPIILDNNPLQMPPAQICSKGKFHIFKYLNMEACKRTQDQFEKALRPTAFNS